MRVATTSHGSKIHLIDPTINPKGTKTACGRERWRSTYIKTPKATEVCQVCARSMWVRIGKLRVFGAKQAKTVLEVPAQQEIEQGQG